MWPISSRRLAAGPGWQASRLRETGRAPYFTRAIQKVERRPAGEEIESPRLPSPESSARLPIFSSTAFVSHRENQICVRPPSTTSSDPVMKEESSLARNRAAFAISPASPKR
jgi:hypothetical protein